MFDLSLLLFSFLFSTPPNDGEITMTVTVLLEKNGQQYVLVVCNVRFIALMSMAMLIMLSNPD